MTKIERYRDFASIVIEWENGNARDFLWRHDRTPYKVLISEILLKRTTSTAAQRVYSVFLENYSTISEVSSSNIDEIEKIIRPIGLYHQRAVGISQAAKYIIEKCDSQLPDKWEDLLKIPHVGLYTAGCILSFGYGIRAPTVDSNVERVLKKCFHEELGDNPSHKKILDLSWKIVPEKDHVAYNYGMIDLGSQVCSYRGCNYESCPLSSICSFKKKND